MQLQIKSARPDETPRIESLQQSAFRAIRRIYRPNATATPVRADADLEVQTIVALHQADIVGAVDYWLAPPHAHLANLVVEPDIQRRGIARQMLSYLESMLAVEGLRSVTLKTIRETGNPLIFERLGFAAVREETADWCESDVHAVLHEVTMTKAFNTLVDS